MRSELLFYPMLAHVLWTVLLYGLLTLFRAPAVWGIGGGADGSNPWQNVEPKVSANLANQFEWPMLFYVICVLLMVAAPTVAVIYICLAWVFMAGRVIHSGIQILTSNIRLRGVVFTMNFLAVLFMWLLYALKIS